MTATRSWKRRLRFRSRRRRGFFLKFLGHMEFWTVIFEGSLCCRRYLETVKCPQMRLYDQGPQHFPMDKDDDDEDLQQDTKS